MLSLNGIIVLELILGGVLMILVFTTLGNTELIVNSSSKAKHELEPESTKIPEKPAHAKIELSD